MDGLLAALFCAVIVRSQQARQFRSFSIGVRAAELLSVPIPNRPAMRGRPHLRPPIGASRELQRLIEKGDFSWIG
jgi:hypothetical protein